ncbi:eukaryotic cytochrome b561-domain-containing protein [Dunaliella salina]|uniref:Eukaryotic cytochrome b561-domain-containing protein n=1 Tax=Dunaliella salina TaxID=3046 RepID=A0ABQ7GQZ7_DUNSA|nr:eukaryotic cytochrome b561-domain-containing protein [Dunaliella salina]|eukprot:KAF5837034.1 eukaryotic cytochrome b561-domain-containing protein [Dunaliella salina]
MRKKVHYSLHMCAVVLAAVGIWAAFASHNLKLPTPIPNLYSPHSYLGMATIVLLGLQFLVAFWAYLYPKASLSQRTALGPFHKFVGRAVWCMGLAAMATGIQEKTTFLQTGKGLSGDALYGGIIVLPGVALLMLALLACLVLFHQTPTVKPQSAEGTDRDGLLPGLGQHPRSDDWQSAKNQQPRSGGLSA